MKRLKLIKKIEGLDHVSTTYKTEDSELGKEMLIVTDKNTGLQDLYEILYTGANSEKQYLSRVCKSVTNKELVIRLQEDFKMII